MLKKRNTTNILQFIYIVGLLIVSVITLNSCEIIGDIFEAGIWTGIIIVVIIIALIIYIFSRFRKRD